MRITGYGRETTWPTVTLTLYQQLFFFPQLSSERITRRLRFLDGVVGGSTCDGARRLFDAWRHYIKTPFYQVLTVPRKTTDEAQALYLDQVISFKQHLEEFLGLEITEKTCLQAVDACNETRALLKHLYELRKRPEPPINGAQTLEVLTASFRMPKVLISTRN